MMRVKYFKPDIFDDVVQRHPIFQVGQVVHAYMPVDRTGEFNPLNMMYEPIPTTNNFNMTFEDCCMDAAINLWKMGKPIELFWSGGIDSSGALIALLETKSDNDVLNIRYTKDSIEEFPLMWEKMVKGTNDPLPYKDMLVESLFNDSSVIKVTGECGDQCFGSDALHANLDKHTDDWESIFTWEAEELLSRYPTDLMATMTEEKFEEKRENLAEVLFTHVDYAPIEIKTIFDLFWWMNFCFKWQDVDVRMVLTYSKTPHWQSTISFFNTENFQRWSIVNHSEKHSGTWETYKQPAKEYINKYVKDEDYRESKTKEPSLIKILRGAANNDYDYDYRRKQRANPNRIKLLLEDGSFWRNKDSIPQGVWEKCLKQ